MTDRPHDLGGQEGHGPIDTSAPPFTHAWERRQWALSKNVPLPGGTIDFWRHGIESMDPAAYRTLPYFEKWCLNELAHRIDQGVFTLDEVLSGQARQSAAPAEPLDMQGALDRLRNNNRDFRVEIERPPAFRPGDRVRTIEVTAPGHTRLPAYAQGHTGTITAQHGGHLFADAGAEGRHEGEHLYTVEFTANELWGKDDPDTVRLDLWEPYLVRA